MSERHQQFQSLLKSNAEAVEALLERLLSADLQADEIARPERLLAAMRHGVLNGGKRLRPFLVIESAALFPGVERKIGADAALIVSDPHAMIA